MNSDGDKIYTKAFNEIYNFVIPTFSFEVIFKLKYQYSIQISAFGIYIWIVYLLFEFEDDFKWKKNWTTKL
jgi:hypothetical protein